MREALKWLFTVVLGGVLKWAFDNFAWDASVQFFETRVGLKEADVITKALGLIIPVTITVLVLMALYGLTWLEIRSTSAPVAGSRQSQIMRVCSHTALAIL